MIGRNAICLFVLITASPTGAATAQFPILVAFEGTINNGSDLHGTLGLGIGQGVLNGQRISGQFRIFPSQAPADISAGSERGDFVSLFPDSPEWFEKPTIQIARVNVPVPDFSQISPMDVSDPDYYNERAIVSLANNSEPESDQVFYFRDHFASEGNDLLDDWATHTLGIDLGDSLDLIDSTELTDLFTITDFSEIAQSNVFDSSWVVGGFDILVRFNLTSLRVEIFKLPGDMDADGDVDRADIAMLMTAFGRDDAAGSSDGDFNGDGNVGLADLAIVQAHFGQSIVASSPTAVPEPAILIHAFLAMLAFAAHRPRRRPSSPS